MELAVVLADVVSFFDAHAPKLKALAKTATIMIAFKNFNLISPPFPAGCCRLLGGEGNLSNDFLDFFGTGDGEAFTYES